MSTHVRQVLYPPPPPPRSPYDLTLPSPRPSLLASVWLGEDDDDEEGMSEDEEEDDVREVLVNRATSLSDATVRGEVVLSNCCRRTPNLVLLARRPFPCVQHGGRCHTSTQ